MVLPNDHDWIKQAQTARKEILNEIACRSQLAGDKISTRQSPANRLLRLKKDYIHFYIAQHSKARLGVAEDKTKTALKKDPRLVALLDNLDDPIIRGTIADLLKPDDRKPIETFIETRQLPAPVTPDFVSAVQEALSGLEKIGVTSEDIKKALLQGGSSATPEDLRKRFETFLNERCKGKDTKKLRFVVE